MDCGLGHRLRHLFMGVLTAVAAMAAAELVLRLKNLDQKNYYVEMWRYAKELKQPAPSADIGHIHVPSKSARLQNVDITINSRGMRGPEPVADGRKRVLLLGSSITLGWGVAEADTMRARLEAALAGRAQVFNAGVGNYNAVRYVSLYKTMLADLAPDVVIVQYFLRDAEVLGQEEGNALIEHSMLAALVYHAVANALHGSKGIGPLVEHYREVYAPDSPGRKAMEQALDDLDAFTRSRHVKVVVAMTPDIHQLKDYPFRPEHDLIRALAERKGWAFVDFLPDLSAVPSQDLYAIPGDPHPNALGHRIMADALLPVLTRTLDAVP